MGKSGLPPNPELHFVLFLFYPGCAGDIPHPAAQVAGGSLARIFGAAHMLDGGLLARPPGLRHKAYGLAQQLLAATPLPRKITRRFYRTLYRPVKK